MPLCILLHISRMYFYIHKHNLSHILWLHTTTSYTLLVIQPMYLSIYIIMYTKSSYATSKSHFKSYTFFYFSHSYGTFSCSQLHKNLWLIFLDESIVSFNLRCNLVANRSLSSQTIPDHHLNLHEQPGFNSYDICCLKHIKNLYECFSWNYVYVKELSNLYETCTETLCML